MRLARLLKALAFQKLSTETSPTFSRRLLFLVDFSRLGIFYPRPVPIRSAQRWSCCVERDAEVRKVCRTSDVFRDRLVLEGGRGRPRQRERTARVNVRASARTNGGTAATSTNPGTSSKPTNPSVCGTQVKSCFRGPGSAPTTSRVGLNRRPCAVNFQTACGLLAWLAGGRGSGFSPSVPHAPFGEKRKTRRDGEPWRQRHPGR